MHHIMHQSSGNRSNIPIWREEDDENNYSTRNCFLNCEEEEEEVELVHWCGGSTVYNDIYLYVVPSSYIYVAGCT